MNNNKPVKLTENWHVYGCVQINFILQRRFTLEYSVRWNLEQGSSCNSSVIKFNDPTKDFL